MELLQCSRISIRFRPKRRASIDRTPGPSMARAAPKVASATPSRRSPVLDNMDHNSTITTSTPVIGVHNPRRKSSPAAVSRNSLMISGQGGPCSSPVTPSLIKRMPETSRRSRRPLPGHPFGNIEKSRCTETSTTSLGVPQLRSNLQIMATSYPSFEGVTVR
jgi:hypothetical protein